LDLSTAYSAQDIIDVSATDSAWVAQSGTNKYAIHQFKVFADVSPENNECLVNWTGKTSDFTNQVVLQVYNQTTTTWETLAYSPIFYGDTIYDYIGYSKRCYGDPGINTDFILSASILDLTNYKNLSGVVSFRVYQLEPA